MMLDLESTFGIKTHKFIITNQFNKKIIQREIYG